MPTTAPLPDDARTLARLLEGRASCRAFRPEPVPQAVIEQILHMAQRTASWCNTQPWQLTITRGDGTERFRQALQAAVQISAVAPDFSWPRRYEGVYDARRRASGSAYYQACGVAPGDRTASQAISLRNVAFFDAPHVVIVSTAANLGAYAAIDCGAYVGQFMLAAHSLGVACVAQAALAARPHVVRDHFALPPDQHIVCGISFGYADTAHPANRFRTERAPLSQSVHWVD
ncbi:nitroreductase [Hydrogenophaga sp.]|uniref:nitroreductase n=1 Tax=Hydrogenophaga sp. TaxID=1904254 RepID=UPI0027274626|nr:nitroreductase [Hydrogenophaga sp.]MDO9439076.1 nitroreductase [Hydrogenophaga sp.]